MALDERDFYVKSHLAYGVDTIRHRLWDHLLRHIPAHEDITVENPCTFVGHVEEHRGKQNVMRIMVLH